MPKFDAVVIGAGNGGLAAACRLANPADSLPAFGEAASNLKQRCMSSVNLAVQRTRATAGRPWWMNLVWIFHGIRFRIISV